MVINIDNFKGDFNESCTLNIPNNSKILEIGHAKRYLYFILLCSDLNEHRRMNPWTFCPQKHPRVRYFSLRSHIAALEFCPQ
jgi:hypothetical protein